MPTSAKRPVEDEVSVHTVSAAYGAELHVVEAGRGPVIVLVPGWTMAWTVFERQIPWLAESHRVIAFDPRGQGRSTTTFDGNSYSQHGKDLETVVDALTVERFSLVGWSASVLEAYDYLGRAGCDRVERLVLIDQTPCPYAVDTASTWYEFDWSSFRAFLTAVTEDRPAFASWFVDWMTSRPLDATDHQWLLDMHKATTTTVATTLAMDWMFRDYTAVAEAVDRRLPVLHFVADHWIEAARAWLGTHTPNTQVAPTCSHIGFWEDPAVFNSQLASFLQTG